MLVLLFSPAPFLIRLYLGLFISFSYTPTHRHTDTHTHCGWIATRNYKFIPPSLVESIDDYFPSPFPPFRLPRNATLQRPSLIFSFLVRFDTNSYLIVSFFFEFFPINLLTCVNVYIIIPLIPLMFTLVLIIQQSSLYNNCTFHFKKKNSPTKFQKTWIH